MAATVNLLSILTRDLGMSTVAARCVLAHGQVYIDERQVGPTEVVWPAIELRGKFLHVLNRTVRLVGMPTPAELAIEDALIPDDEEAPPHVVNCTCQRCEDWWASR